MLPVLDADDQSLLGQSTTRSGRIDGGTVGFDERQRQSTTGDAGGLGTLETGGDGFGGDWAGGGFQGQAQCADLVREGGGPGEWARGDR